MNAEPRITALPSTGAHVVTAHGAAPLLRLRTGRHTALESPPAALHEALAADSLAADSSGYLSRLTLEVQEREHADEEQRWPPARRAVGLVGEGVLAEEISRALKEWGARVTRTASAASVQAAALIVSVADGADERRDRAVLDNLPDHGAAHLRVYREGECVFVDPLATEAADATATHVSRRRVAASTAPGALDAWQRSGPASDRPLDSPTVALVTARVLTVALAWAQDDDTLPRLRTTLWKLVPALGRVTEHPVIAYPAPHPRASR
ncbi:hypothetical protein [Microbacterium sp. GCS4]|uniref:hypothetical protein n=1 Tax=Microbacterium sp. GCS4 TaxID=1692239 RepID=UPI0006805A31|nr:hypothetical protein [Microbacterium sp. GCS4]KNY05269.1 hypothetical protein AKH00_12950 [Microbacterium sp. GCS4]